MLDLDSPKWSELDHAYGKASDIPSLLSQLQSLSKSQDDNEPWFSLWSSLAHQGDVYPASFAAVPHIVNFLSQNPTQADFSFFQFPAWVEVCRQKNSVDLPEELKSDYFAALNKLPSLVAISANRAWDSDFLCCALAAIAAAKGFGSVAEAILELNPEVSENFLKWHFGQ